MAKPLKSSELIDSIKRRAFIPSDQDTFTDEDFLDMLNEEINYFSIPRLLSTHEEYLVTYEDIELVDGKFRYDIPSRAIGNKLRGLFYTDGEDENTVNQDLNLIKLSRISYEDLSDYTNYGNNSSYSYSHLFYIENNEIVIVDEVSVSQTFLRMYFYLKPNTLVKDDEAGVISNIDRNTGVITLQNFPESFSTVPQIDFVQNKSPNLVLSYDLQPTSVNQNTLSVTLNTTDIPEDLKVGDYINLANECIVPQLPTEMHAILAQRVAIAALEALGDTEGIQVAQRRLEMMEQSSIDLIDNRVESAPEKIRNRNGTLKQASYRYYYGRNGKIY